MNNLGIYIAYAILAVLIILVFALASSKEEKISNIPGAQELAVCLKDSGAKFYGASWCPFCIEQKKIFGNAQEYLPYVECSLPDRSQNTLCKEEGIVSYPTWEFSEGLRIPTTLNRIVLSKLSSCENTILDDFANTTTEEYFKDNFLNRVSVTQHADFTSQIEEDLGKKIEETTLDEIVDLHIISLLQSSANQVNSSTAE